MPSDSIKEDRMSYRYSLHPFFPCRVYLQDEKYHDCRCKLEAKDTVFTLVHLIGYSESDVEVIDLITGEEVVL